MITSCTGLRSRLTNGGSVPVVKVHQLCQRNPDDVGVVCSLLRQRVECQDLTVKLTGDGATTCLILLKRWLVPKR